ncbi:flavodoxin family protein [Acetobacterium woodii]|nr:flavodoxin family protein [Acetobacterium woodii]
MKIIAIMGSPHKGKGYQIVQKIEMALKRWGDIDFQYIFLKDVNLQPCIGCFACIAKGESFCPLQDDRKSIETEMLSADGIILSSPGYTQNVSGLMKNFMDRFAYSLHRPKFFNQSLMLVANGGSGLGKVIKALTMNLGGSRKICELKITTTPWETTLKYRNQTDQAIEKSAKKFYRAMIDKQKIRPDLGNLIWFKIFKKMASLSEQNLPADYQFYNDKPKFFYPVKVSLVKNGLAEVIAVLAVWSMKKQVDFK